MDTTNLLIVLIIGSFVVAMVATRRWGHTELRRLSEQQRQVTETTGARAIQEGLAQLLRTNRDLMADERERAGTELGHTHNLIGTQLEGMRTELERVTGLVHELEGNRQRSLGELTNELQRQHEGLHQLTRTTQQLRETLASTKARGQWGERMADDILRLAGFVEGIQYQRQQAVRGGRVIPDYTFHLPNGRVLYMDVKFPLDNYLKFLETDSELEARRHRDQFIRDVRDRLKELRSRGYLDDTDLSVDCLLMFIPNEQVYAFVHEHDRSLIDEALRHKIVLCSPNTLFAVLAVIRQAVENFRLERTSHEVVGLLGEFTLQWTKYCDQLDQVQKRFDSLARDYEALTSTRRRALQRPLDRIDALQATTTSETIDPPLALEA